MKYLSALSTLVMLCACSTDAVKSGIDDPLIFDADDFTVDSIVMQGGDTVYYKAYKDLLYVTNVEDSAYQTINIFVPEKVVDKGPIFLRTYIGGYMASKASNPRADDATGRALKEGFVVCIPGSRGANSVVNDSVGGEIYTGMAPNALLDLKAAVRYIRHNSDNLPADVEKIFVDGTSAGGAMASLLGATGNARRYQRPLGSMGAAQELDNIYAAICFCPITDLNHADMEYEWLFGCTNRGVRKLNAAQIAISDQLASLCPNYIDSLELRDDDGSVLKSGNYKQYISKFLIASAQKALAEGLNIPDNIGVEIKNDSVNSIDLDEYLSYVASVRELKTPPAFDAWGVLAPYVTPENKVFGDSLGEPANFTDFSLRKHLKDPSVSISTEMGWRVRMMNPMGFIGTYHSNVAPCWYIRHGALDTDTSFLVPINLATLLNNRMYKVNFSLPWGRGHEGDYDLDELFEWIKETADKT